MTDLSQNIMRDGFTFRKIKSNRIARTALATVFILAGVSLIIFPAVGAEIAVMFLGAALIALGLGIIFADALKRLKDISAYALPGACIAGGVLLIVFRVFTAGILLPLIVGLWALVYGIANFKKSLGIRKHDGYWRSMYALAVILIGLGVCVLLAMLMGGNAIGVLLGLALISFGVPLFKKPA